MRTFGCACASGVIVLACAAAVFAQPPQTPPGQAKKRVPHQTVDRGDNDAARDLTPEEDADVQRQFGKNESGVVLTALADGTVAAKLDESYMEALTITRADDGSLQFGHTTGPENAARAVKSAGGTAAAKKTDVTRRGAPKLEEKE
jgi:hypothetical protein